MKHFFLTIAGTLAIALSAWAQTSTPAAPATQREESVKSIDHGPIAPGAADGQIAFAVAKMLEKEHYSRQRFNDSMASRFLDRYMDLLDPQHVHFTQQDLADFEQYRTNLSQMTIGNARNASAAAGCEVFNRFLERIKQHVTYVQDTLKNEKFDFTTDDRIVVNRHEQPYPKDLAEAKKLWRDRLRFEYLQEKLAKQSAKTSKPAKDAKPEAAKPKGKPKTESEEIVDTLSHRYQRNLRAFEEWDSDDVLQIYLTAMARVYDPHSDYMGHAQLDSFAISMNLSLYGIGAELISEDGYCTIRRLMPGGPAIKSGKLKENDRIVAVAQSNQPPVDVIEMSLSKAVQLIRGPKGTEVRLTILPAGDTATPTVLSLVRDKIPLEDAAAKAKVIETSSVNGEPTRIGVIDLPSFYTPFDVGDPKRVDGEPSPAYGKSATADVARLLKKFKQENVRGVILDLRRNGGGSLEEAIRLTGLFIKNGPVVLVKNVDGKVQEDDDRDSGVAYDGPLMVLTSRFSASASEIVAGALQDYGRAVIVGDASTHGKGTVQSVNPLRPRLNVPDDMLANDPGALKLTIRKFYRPSGGSTQLKGVVPDLILPSPINESKEVGEASLDNPLEWDTIDAAAFERLNLVAPYVDGLKKLSEERRATNKEWAYVNEDIERTRKALADKTISLNEQVRLKEKSEDEARQKSRDKERLARKSSPEVVHELSLKQTDEPGLPAPAPQTNSVSAKVTSGVTNVAKAGGTEADVDADDEKAPAVDAALIEGEHILLDYLAALSKGGVLTAGQSGHTSNAQ